MSSFRLGSRGRPGFSAWKLGDSIQVCSILAHIGSNITLYVDDPYADGHKLIQHLSDSVYTDKYKLEFKRGNHPTVLYPDQFYLENNVDVVSYTFNKRVTGYVTTQKYSRSASRSIGDISTFVGDRESFDLSQAHTRGTTIKQLFETVGNAQEHIGAASGISWVAMSTNTPCTILLNREHRRNYRQWDYALEAMYRNSNVRIYDV